MHVKQYHVCVLMYLCCNCSQLHPDMSILCDLVSFRNFSSGHVWNVRLKQTSYFPQEILISLSNSNMLSFYDFLSNSGNFIQFCCWIFLNFWSTLTVMVYKIHIGGIKHEMHCFKGYNQSLNFTYDCRKTSLNYLISRISSKRSLIKQ